MRYLFSLLFTLITSLVIASPADSTTLDYSTYIEIVKTHHPIVYQGNIKQEIGEAKVTKAKGGFDPKIQGNAQQKYFDGKQYYSYLHGGLVVPTWFGVKANAGYGLNGGERLNPESYTPSEGLWNVGLSVNLGKGLFIDARRAELKQAKIYQEQTEQIQRLMLNQLVFDARNAYWDWFKAYNKVTILEEALDLAEIRHKGLVASAFLGDKPTVDTLKTIIQVQDRRIKLEQAKADLFNKQSKMEVFLWQEGFIPLEVSKDIMPEKKEDLNLSNPPVKNDSTDFVQNHPEILSAKYQIAIQEIDFRLKREDLKPKVELKYNLLSDQTTTNWTPENYNWGATVSYPIFTRKERASRNISELQLAEQKAKLANKEAEINYKINAAYTQMLSTYIQAAIYKENVANYAQLLEAETELFMNGESSIFLVNTRDQDWMNARLKFIDMLYLTQVYTAAYNYHIVSY